MMRACLVVVVSLGSIGCGGGSGQSVQDRFGAASSGPVEVRTVNGVVRNARGRFATTGATPTERARGFIDRFASDFGLTGAATLAVVGETADGEYARVVLSRLAAGLAVDGALIQVHFEGDVITLVTAQLPAAGAFGEATPAITEADAAAAVAARLGVDALPRAPAIALAAYDRGLATSGSSSLALAYRVLATGPDGARIGAYVDARSGEVLAADDWSPTARERYIGRYDSSLASGCAVQPCAAEDVQELAHLVVYTESGVQAPSTPDEDAVYGALADAYAYWQQAFGRDSFDGRGAPLAVFIGHPAPADGFGGEQHQAVWKDDLGALFVRNSFVARDVVLHELGHGLIASVDSGVLLEPECTPAELAAAQAARSDDCRRETAPLRNLPGPSGALNEGVADVLAVFADHASGGDPSDWQITDKLGVVRDLAGTSSSDHRDRYDPSASTHANSQIFSLAMYLLTVGGAHPRLQGKAVVAIGRTKAEQILYRALTLYFAPLTDIEDARWKMLRACEDFVSRDDALAMLSADCGSVLNAFAAVGYGEWDSDRDTWVDSADNCDMSNPDQADADRDGVGDACEGGAGPFPMVPPSTPSCPSIYQGATTDTSGWIEADWPLIGQSDLEVLELSSGTDAYYEFRVVCSYDCSNCGAGGGGINATLTWQPYDPADYGLQPTFDYQIQCQLAADELIGQIGPFRSSTHLARVSLNFGLPNNQLYNDRQAIYLDTALTELEAHAAMCP